MLQMFLLQHPNTAMVAHHVNTPDTALAGAHTASTVTAHPFVTGRPSPLPPGLGSQAPLLGTVQLTECWNSEMCVTETSLPDNQAPYTKSVVLFM